MSVCSVFPNRFGEWWTVGNVDYFIRQRIHVCCLFIYLQTFDCNVKGGFFNLLIWWLKWEMGSPYGTNLWLLVNSQWLQWPSLTIACSKPFPSTCDLLYLIWWQTPIRKLLLHLDETIGKLLDVIGKKEPAIFWRHPAKRCHNLSKWKIVSACNIL